MKQIILMTAVLGIMLTAFDAGARTRYNNVHGRGYYQTQRINQGVKNGHITKQEHRQLRQQQAQLRELTRMAAADGRITPRERQMLAQARYNASQNIYSKKHNARNRY